MDVDWSVFCLNDMQKRLWDLNLKWSYEMIPPTEKDQDFFWTHSGIPKGSFSEIWTFFRKLFPRDPSDAYKDDTIEMDLGYHLFGLAYEKTITCLLCAFRFVKTTCRYSIPHQQKYSSFQNTLDSIFKEVSDA
jgi:hypothetical protein